jgi:hypothetical protein
MSLLTDLDVWYQFDLNEPLRPDNRNDENTPGTGDYIDRLVDNSGGTSPITYNSSPTGVEQALECGTPLSFVKIDGSDSSGHWSNKGDEDQEWVYAFRMTGARDFTPAGDGNMAGKWGAFNIRRWRIRNRSFGTASQCQTDVLIYTTAGGDIGLDFFADGTTGLVPLEDGTNYWIFYNYQAGTGRHEARLYSDSGLLGFEVVVENPPSTATLGSPVSFGGVGSSARCSGHDLDLFASWSRVLTEQERLDIVNGGSGIRFSDIVGTIDSASAGTNMDRMTGALTDHSRNIWVGDSLSRPLGNNARLGWAMPLVKSMPITAYSHGFQSTGSGGAVFEFAPGTGTNYGTANDNPWFVGDNSGNANLSYGVELAALGTGATATSWYGLPSSKLAEVYGNTGVAPTNGIIGTVTLANDNLSPGATGRFTDAGDEVRARLVYREASSQLNSVVLREHVGDGGSNFTTLDMSPGPGTNALNANLAAGQLTMANNLDGEPRIEIVEDSNDLLADAGGAYLQMLNLVAYKVDLGAYERGVYWGSLGDDSFRYLGFGNDTAASGAIGITRGKTVSEAQVAAWLEATTIDPEQDVYMWWHMDTEGIQSDAEWQTDFAACLDQMNGAAATAGITGNVRHCIVIPPVSQGEFQGTRDYNTYANIVMRDAARNLSNSRSDLAVFSIMDSTEAVLFDGRTEATDWLTTNGYNAFSYGGVGTVNLATTNGGDLFDSGTPTGVHPFNQDVAAFFVSFVADATPDGSGPGTGETFIGSSLMSQLPVEEYPDFFQYLSVPISENTGSSVTTLMYCPDEVIIDSLSIHEDDGTLAASILAHDADPGTVDGGSSNISVNAGGASAGLDLPLTSATGNIVPKGRYLNISLAAGGAHRATVQIRYRTARK